MEIEDVNDLLSRKLEGKTVRIDPYSYQEKKGTTNVFFSKVDFSNDGKSAKHKDNWKWKSDNNREKDEGLSIGEWRRFTDESLVVINWEKLTNWKDAYNKNDKRKDYGIYQILGGHRNLKDNSLLYIGKASEQTFGKQISEEEAWLKNACDLTIYLGRIQSIDDKDKEQFSVSLRDSIIEDVEALLIYFHTPAYNSVSTSEPPNPKNNLRIINVGNRGALCAEISHKGLRLYK
jgi:hypothetical protein